MLKQYLVRIKTVTGNTLYIDDQDTVWSKDLAEDPYDDIHPTYFDDLEEASDNAELYGGEVVECKFIVEPVKRRGERSEKEEETCYNCKHGALGFDGDLGCDIWRHGGGGTACQFWKGETNGN